MRVGIFRLRTAGITLGVLLLLLGGGVAATALAGPTAGRTQEAAAAWPITPADPLVVVEMDGPGMSFRLFDGMGAGVKRPSGFISPDKTTLYALEVVRNGTVVRAHDLKTGKELRQTRLAGSYFVPAEAAGEPQPAFSRDGRRMILKRGVSDAEAATWQKTGRPRSRFAVLDTGFARPPRLLDLEGEFWFDALSADGKWLYLIEIQDEYPMSYSPEKAPNYQVRAYDVDNGRLAAEPVVDKRDLEQMSGYGQGGVFSRRGDWLYTVYTRPREEPFIHALNLPNRTALCIDLPFGAAKNWEHDFLWSLALSRDSRYLYAVNGATGEVAQVDAANGYTVRQSATLPVAAAARPSLLARVAAWLAPAAAAKMDRIVDAALTPDGKTLFALGQKGLLAIKTADLTLVDRYLPDLELSGLVLSADGEWLYTVDRTQGRLLVVNATTGELAGSMSMSRAWGVLPGGKR